MQQTLGGYAGTGKSTVVRMLKNCLPGFKVVAFTGKAANVLRRKGIDDASTIHSAIYLPFVGLDGRVRFQLRDEMLEGIERFIVDEASMVSNSLYKDLISFGLLCIFVGDHGQLEPVGPNPNLMADPDYVLERIHRNSGDIPRFAEWIRLGRAPADFKPTSNAVTLVNAHAVTGEMVLGADQVIVAYNKSRVELNHRIRQATGRKDIVEVGERVMCLRNDRDQAIFNGMQGTVTGVIAVVDKIRIDFDTHGGVRPGLPVDRHQFGKEKNDSLGLPRSVHPFDYAYVITAHKARGDEWPTVLVFEQRCSRWDHCRWAYTAASRAQQKLTCVVAGKGGVA
jgi:ATP-dependent exoDNAse (exonuclease V) alpha subunit